MDLLETSSHPFRSIQKTQNQHQSGDDPGNLQMEHIQVASRRRLEHSNPTVEHAWQQRRLEKLIWDRALRDGLKCRTHSAELLCTVPPLLPRKMLEDLCEIVYEEYQFCGFCAPTCASMVQYDPLLKPFDAPRGCVVVDSGYSFSHVTPCYEGFPLNQFIRRLDIGGKALTNYLKELISYRQWNMMDETWLVNYIKERLSFVSQDFHRDMKRGSQVVKEFVLPDYISSQTGWVKGMDPAPMIGVLGVLKLLLCMLHKEIAPMPAFFPQIRAICGPTL